MPHAAWETTLCSCGDGWFAASLAAASLLAKEHAAQVAQTAWNLARALHPPRPQLHLLRSLHITNERERAHCSAQLKSNHSMLRSMEDEPCGSVMQYYHILEFNSCFDRLSTHTENVNLFQCRRL